MITSTAHPRRPRRAIPDAVAPGLAILLLGLTGCYTASANSAPGYTEAMEARRATREELRPGLPVPGRGQVRMVPAATDGGPPAALLAYGPPGAPPERTIALPLPEAATEQRFSLLSADRRFALVRMAYELEDGQLSLVVCDLDGGVVTDVHRLHKYDIVNRGVESRDVWISTPGPALSPEAKKAWEKRQLQLGWQSQGPLDLILHRIDDQGRIVATAARITGTCSRLHPDSEHGLLYGTTFECTELLELDAKGNLRASWRTPKKIASAWLSDGYGPYRVKVYGYSHNTSWYIRRVRYVYGFRRDTETWEWLETTILNNAWMGV